MQLETWIRPRVEEPGVFACPKCKSSSFVLGRGASFIDGSGFESYRFECKECETKFAGVIDPFDDSLLLSVVD